MAHLERYESFQTQKAKLKKEQAKNKERKSSKKRGIFTTDKERINGIVLETTYNNASVLYNDNEIIQAELSRDFDAICNKTVYVGDKVIIAKEDGKYVISNVLRRRTVLSRNKCDSTRNSNTLFEQIIAVNIDVAVIVVSCDTPPLHPRFIDRYLILLKNSGIEPIICLNKADLKTQKEEDVLKIYRNLGITIVETSTLSSYGIDELKEHLNNKQAILVGHSGVGKSSITNLLLDITNVKTGEVSEKSGKGKHTTTTTKYYKWNENSSIIDTPGIRSLDLSDLSKLEIKSYFHEFYLLDEDCKYSDCLHYKEPIEDCAIKRALANNTLPSARYDSYIRIVSDLFDK